MSCSKDNLYISPYLQSLGLGFSSNWQGVLDDLDIFLFVERVEARAKVLFEAMNLFVPLLHVINRKIIYLNMTKSFSVSANYESLFTIILVYRKGQAIFQLNKCNTIEVD